jgi:hypothetical protein
MLRGILAVYARRTKLRVDSKNIVHSKFTVHHNKSISYLNSL